MTSTYQFTIDKITTEFQQMIELYQEIQKVRTNIQEKLLHVKEIYNTLIKPNNKKSFLFCLDTFFFQYKILNIEMDNLTRYTSLINNRMYGDYYKLHNIIISAPTNQEYLLDMSENFISKKYCTYRDLEPFHEYPISDTQNLHEDIVHCINLIFAYYSKKNGEIEKYNMNQIGMSIDSFINTLEYENALVHEQMVLYIGYLEFFHKTQMEYLTKLLGKMNAFQKEVDVDLHSTNGSEQGQEQGQEQNQNQEPEINDTIFTITGYREPTV